MSTDPHTEQHLQHLDNIWKREVRKHGRGVGPGLLAPALATVAGSIMGSLLLLARDYEIGDGEPRDIDAECLGIWHENNDRTKGVRDDFSPRSCWEALITGAIETPKRHRRAVGALKQLFNVYDLEKASQAGRGCTVKSGIITVPDDEETGFLIPSAMMVSERIHEGFRGLLDWLAENGVEIAAGAEDDFGEVRLAFLANRGFLRPHLFHAHDRFGGDVMSMTIFKRYLEFRFEPGITHQLWLYVAHFNRSMPNEVLRAA